MSPERHYDLVMYARRYHWLLHVERGEALRALAEVSPNVAAKILAALRRLSEFLEAEEEWLPRRVGCGADSRTPRAAARRARLGMSYTRLRTLEEGVR